MNIVKEQLKEMSFSIEEPENYSIINRDINSILLDEKNFEVLEENVKTIVIWWTNWIWKEIVEKLEKENINRLNIWSRNKETNLENNFIWWDIFDTNSEAYKTILELAESEEPLKIILNAGFNMDKTPKEIDWKNYKDAIDPITWEVWEDITNENVTITPQEKNQIRKKIADRQIAFYKTFFETLSNRESKEKITIVFSNWTIAKYKESPFLKDSMYWYSKQETTKIITNLFWKLKEKNVHVKDVFLALVETDMLKVELLEQTAKLAKILSPYFPLEWKEMNQQWLLNPENIWNFLFKISQINPSKISDQISIINEYDMDIEKISENFEKQKMKIIKLIKNKNFKKEDNYFLLNDDLIDFLLELREKSLDIYYEKNKSKKIKKANLYKTLDIFKENLKTIDKKINFEHLVYLSLKAENNYP